MSNLLDEELNQGSNSPQVTVLTDKGERVPMTLATPLTVILHQGDIDIREILPTDGGPDIVEIGPDHTLQVVATMGPKSYKIVTQHPWLRKSWESVVGAGGKHEVSLPETIEEMRASSLASRHVFGMLFLIGEALFSGKRPFVKLPESYLHPAQQCQLGDLFVKLSNGGIDADKQT